MERAKQKIIVVGSGIIGAMAAYELQAKGADVLVLDAGSARATDASFGWINASFYQTPEYFALRVEGMQAYKRLEQRIDVPVSWSGGLCWEHSGADLDAQYESLHAQGYPCRIIGKDEIAALEPDLGAGPERAIHFPAEASIESGNVTDLMLRAAQGLGARLGRGFRVCGFSQHAGRVVGVRTDEGVFEADQILVAAGTGTEPLLATLQIPLPMLQRPALVLRTRPVGAKISHILATDFGEVRQLPDGRLLTPAAIGHQADSANSLAEHPDEAAENAMGRLRELFPNLSIKLEGMQLAHRPVPQDGFPAVGAVAPGLYVAVMHSGITLAALMGELIGQEMLRGAGAKTEAWLGAFRPERFA
ncbi:MAG: FAD-dependent oxidoreductase [Planktotalea sp.]|uniref:NAD(P)/FAD-dependent oxidoreductase n=1 Tax=Planktotalea sp. TaxID=2029877 RepID=UPI003C71487F